MFIIRAIVLVGSLAGAAIFTIQGFSDSLPSWIGGCGWAFVAVYVVVNQLTQRKLKALQDSVLDLRRTFVTEESCPNTKVDYELVNRKPS
jgi:hypothetical protein